MHIKKLFVIALIIILLIGLYSSETFSNSGKVVKINLSKQSVSCYSNNKLAATLPISSGKKGHETPKGTFYIHDKKVDEWSYTYNVPMDYCCWFLGYSYGIHAGDLPGYPASHGCVRVGYGNAKWFYSWTPVGTKIVIY